MSRRRKSIHRSTLPDPRFNSIVVTELVGVVLKEGKKTIAERKKKINSSFHFAGPAL